LIDLRFYSYRDEALVGAYQRRSQVLQETATTTSKSEKSEECDQTIAFRTISIKSIWTH